MDKKTKDKLTREIERFASSASTLTPQETESLAAEILAPLLAEDGYNVKLTSHSRDDGFDLRAGVSANSSYQANSIGIQVKRFRRPIPVESIRSLMGAGVLQGLDRVMLVSPSGFTSAAKRIAARDLPIQIELIDIEALKTWIGRIEVDVSIDRAEVEQILRVVTRRFAQLIAQDASNLDKLEWRHLEMTLAEVFDGLGFSVELTPGSKDGGKDIILQCIVSGNKRTYIVEVKHWRAGKRVGHSTIKSFLNVIVRESRQGGLFLSTSGYSDKAFEMLSEMDRERLKFGSEEKIVNLCKTYVKMDSGIWSPPELLTEVLFEGTQ